MQFIATRTLHTLFNVDDAYAAKLFHEIVLLIAFSAGYILWESIQKLLNPTPLTNLPWVAAAAIIGFLGNKAVAYLQIRTGRAIGSEASEAMVADGLHARTDGLASLAVLVAVGGAWLGHQRQAGISMGVEEDLPTRESHRIAEAPAESMFATRSRFGARDDNLTSRRVYPDCVCEAPD